MALKLTLNPKLKVDWQFHPFKTYPMIHTVHWLGLPKQDMQGNLHWTHTFDEFDIYWNGNVYPKIQV